MSLEVGDIGWRRVGGIVRWFANERVFGEDDQAVEDFCFKVFTMLDDLGMLYGDFSRVGISFFDGLGLLENTLWGLFRR